MFIVRFPAIFYVCRCGKTPVRDLARKHLDEMDYQTLILTMPPFQLARLPAYLSEYVLCVYMSGV